MHKIKARIPKRMKYLFWSYDIGSLDLEEDKDYIITQVLNYGTWDDLKLLYKFYSEKDIEEVVSHPQRGIWFEKTLNFWTKMLDIKIEEEVYEKAIFRLTPHELPRFNRDTTHIS